LQLVIEPAFYYVLLLFHMMSVLGRLAALLCLAIALGDVQDCSQLDYSKGCQRYPNNMVVMVQVGDDYIDFFRNWYKFAIRHANPECMKLMVMADDKATYHTLSEMKDDSEFNKWDFDVLDSEREANKPDKPEPAKKAAHKHEEPETQDDASAADVADSLLSSGAEDATAEDAKEKNEDSLVEMPYSWNYGSEAYKMMMSQRPRYISSLIEDKCSVLFSDIDIVWLQNPFSVIRNVGFAEANMYLTADSIADTPRNRKHPPPLTYNGGFVFFQPTQFTKEVVREWSAHLKAHPGPNQPVLNAVLAKKGMTGVVVLPGDQFKDRVRADARWSDAVLVHANWLVGHEEKVKWLNARDLWKPAETKATSSDGSSGKDLKRTRRERKQEELREESSNLQMQMDEQERRKKAYLAQEMNHVIRTEPRKLDASEPVQPKDASEPGMAEPDVSGLQKKEQKHMAEPDGFGLQKKEHMAEPDVSGLQKKEQRHARVSSAAEVEISSHDA